MEARDSFIFYRSFYEAIRELPLRDQGLLFTAICEYVLDGKGKDFSGVNLAIWTLIKPQLNANIKRFENGKLGAKHGRKGGRPTQTNTTPLEPQNNPIAVKKITPNNNVNYNLNLNENKEEINTNPHVEKLNVKSKNLKVQDKEIEKIQEVASEVIKKYNETFKKAVVSFEGFKNNLLHWETIHGLPKILRAIEGARMDNFWRDKMTLTVLFRKKNPQGESVDYIEDLANQKDLPKIREPEKELTLEQAMEIFDRKHGIKN